MSDQKLDPMRGRWWRGSPNVGESGVIWSDCGCDAKVIVALCPRPEVADALIEVHTDARVEARVRRDLPIPPTMPIEKGSPAWNRAADALRAEDAKRGAR